MSFDDKPRMLRFVHHVKPSVHDILPAPYDRQGTRPAWLRWHNRRYTRFAFLTLVALSVLAILRGFNVGDGLLYIADPPENHIFPPLYPQYHESELRLSQHDPGLPYPEGREGKFLFMANHVHASGWGNVMQELLLNSYLAYKSERAFVFDNYTWNRDGSDYTDYNGKLIPSRVPLSALIQGPTVGSPFPPGDPAPRAVIKEYWDQVCPHPTVIFSDEVTNTLPGDASAQATLDAWVEKLNSMSDRCVEIDRESAQIFSIWIFGSTRALDIFPDFAKSPIMTQFRWSPLVEDAFKANRPIFSPEKGLQSYFPLFSLFSGDNAPYTMLPGLLVLHVRRGDFADHCMHLARWSSRWNGFNSFTELPDQFEPPPGAGWGENTDENKALYMKRCFPTIAQIVARVEEVRQTPAGIGLKNVYIMTNGAKEWVDELKKALKTTGHFERVTGSRDLRLSWEQKYVAQSVDMLIGQRAQVLIGNGFSSLTSNIVMMRMAMGLSPNSTRFW